MNPFPYLRPGGDGLYTVHTKSEIKRPLQLEIYSAATPEEILPNWERSWKQVGTRPTILGVPSDTGGGIHRGANWGPLYLRKMLRNQIDQFVDAGDILVVPQLLDDSLLNGETIKKIQEALYQGEEWPVSPLSMLDHFCHYYFENFSTPLLTLGGDHSISAPIIRHFVERYPKAAIIHFDAHTDLMTSRLGIDYCFATWASECSKLINDEKRFIQLGIRSSGKDKSYWEDHFKVTQLWSDELIETSASEVAKKLLSQFQEQNAEAIYLSFDVDCLDSRAMPFTGTAEENGLSIQWINDFLMELRHSPIPLRGADIVELAPFVNMMENQSVPADDILLSFSSIPKMIATILCDSSKEIL